MGEREKKGREGGRKENSTEEGQQMWKYFRIFKVLKYHLTTTQITY